MNDQKLNYKYKYKKIIDQITFCIDLNYILAEAQKEKYIITLHAASLEELIYQKNSKKKYKNIFDSIKWSNDEYYLFPNYEISYGLLYNYIVNNKDNLVKLVVKSDTNSFFQIHRETIIYFPINININQLKKKFNNILDIQFDDDPRLEDINSVVKNNDAV